jgi:hypothetical protein
MKFPKIFFASEGRGREAPEGEGLGEGTPSPTARGGLGGGSPPRIFLRETLLETYSGVNNEAKLTSLGDNFRCKNGTQMW